MARIQQGDMFPHPYWDCRGDCTLGGYPFHGASFTTQAEAIAWCERNRQQVQAPAHTVFVVRRYDSHWHYEVVYRRYGERMTKTHPELIPA